MAERRSAAGEALGRVSEWADGHLGLLRSLSAGLAAAGLLLLARSVRLTTKFTNAVDIPVEFIEKNVKLRGKIHHVTEKGLEVEHIPITIPIVTSIQRKWQSKGLLLGRFLSVCLNEEILRQGLGRTARIEGLHHDSRLYWKLHKRLLRAELKALKKNKGIWQEESFSERVRDRISNNKCVQTLKQFVNWLRSYI